MVETTIPPPERSSPSPSPPSSSPAPRDSLPEGRRSRGASSRLADANFVAAQPFKPAKTKVPQAGGAKPLFLCSEAGCGYTARTGGNMKQHKQNIHNIDVTWHHCNIPPCSCRAKAQSWIKKHKMQVHDIDVVWHYCDFPECEYRTKQQQHIKEHKMHKHDVDITWHFCEEVSGAGNKCDFKAKTQKQIKQHRINVHNLGVVWHYCDQAGCKYQAKRMAEIKLHKMQKHNIGVIWHYCVGGGGCEFRAKTKSDLNRHSRRRHSLNMVGVVAPKVDTKKILGEDTVVGEKQVKAVEFAAMKKKKEVENEHKLAVAQREAHTKQREIKMAAAETADRRAAAVVERKEKAAAAKRAEKEREGGGRVTPVPIVELEPAPLAVAAPVVPVPNKKGTSKAARRNSHKKRVPVAPVTPLALTLSTAAEILAQEEEYSKIVLCDGCDREVHLSELGLDNVPEGDFFCDRCDAPGMGVTLAPVNLVQEVGGGGGGGGAEVDAIASLLFLSK
ncbi:hypothetical protein TeGR_g7444 [Tetraparma gracilis]|uniref:C2H2-type domain-containing protein n=1 Tax=Tetraparma gracilis TaxID=2962635 RepID=A0ABQ6N691_9STRA|nr:hypothetical protein TeGR_g7444 [Tetraparma gracilis]